ncbi:(Lyso)-N-acylphosphatidylethanolamine lipase-like [Arctopsyche grandis]|uniref:(Lyso)-N-acylphosphatidylethanolamine lipase-like n=1 Tax=Arctopsyche grandis TaxID=121162 RepID=UPI00406D9381
MFVSVAAALFLIGAAFAMTRRNKRNSVETNGWEPGWYNWSKSSAALLGSAEKRILSSLRTSYNGRYIDIGPIVGDGDKVWTLSFNETSEKTPLVLLHGLGAGVALWVMNLDELADNRPVHAIDLLGFGRSSRPSFSLDGKVVEMQMVTFLEEWRRKMKLDNFILLGHSLGGFLAASYTMQYPERVKHLILADAWGIPESPPNVFEYYKLPMWVRMIFYVLRPLNPLWPLRAAGPWGESLVGKARANLVAKFASFLPQAEDVIPQYIHQCNSQKPSGESAFHAMMHMWAFAKIPIVRRMHRLDSNTRLTMLFGAKSWVDSSIGYSIQKDLRNSTVDVHIIPEAGHHVYLDQPEIFNKFVLDVCYCEDEIDPNSQSNVDNSAVKSDDVKSNGNILISKNIDK